MSSSNMTEITDYITTNAASLATTTGMLPCIQFCTALSGHLNTLWDPAWNVIILTTAAYSDAVLYGYAFRSHWVWINGYRNNVGTYLSFVIWKDYNCQVWSTIPYASGGGFDSAHVAQMTNAATNTKNNFSVDDIWGAAYGFMTYLTTTQALFTGDDKAFSAVLSQDYENTYYAGRFCSVGSNYHYSDTERIWPIASTINFQGMYFVFQTR